METFLIHIKSLAYSVQFQFIEITHLKVEKAAQLNFDCSNHHKQFPGMFH